MLPASRDPFAGRIPAPPPGTSPSTSTGILVNPVAEDFQVSGTPAQFLFATEDGTISTWATVNDNIPTSALLAIDHSSAGAVYKGLAILTPQYCREFLAIATLGRPTMATVGTPMAAPSDIELNLRRVKDPRGDSRPRLSGGLEESAVL
jgi:hypothetical protein